jgi:peroxin-11B
LAEKKRATFGLNLLKILGDMIPAAQGSETFQTLMGWSANDKLCGLGGLVSAAITSYQLYE